MSIVLQPSYRRRFATPIEPYKTTLCWCLQLPSRWSKGCKTDVNIYYILHDALNTTLPRASQLTGHWDSVSSAKKLASDNFSPNSPIIRCISNWHEQLEHQVPNIPTKEMGPCFSLLRSMGRCWNSTHDHLWRVFCTCIITPNCLGSLLNAARTPSEVWYLLVTDDKWHINNSGKFPRLCSEREKKGKRDSWSSCWLAFCSSP